MAIKNVIVVLDDAAQHQRLMDALDTAIKCSLNPKDIADFKHIRTMVAKQTVSFEKGYEGALNGISRIIVSKTISNLSTL